MLINLKLSSSITGVAKGVYIMHLSYTIPQYFYVMQSMPYMICTVKHSEKLKNVYNIVFTFFYTLSSRERLCLTHCY